MSIGQRSAYTLYIYGSRINLGLIVPPNLVVYVCEDVVLGNDVFGSVSSFHNIQTTYLWWMEVVLLSYYGSHGMRVEFQVLF